MWKAPSLTTFLLSPAHNIQIAYGKQALLGKVPYLDLIHFYGPLQIYTSAFGLWLSDTVIPEILICALGYAASLYLIFHLVEKESTWFHGAAAALAGYAFLSRFYKWYYWLFPLLALYFFRRFLHERRSREDGWLLAAGLAGGVGALYRVDLGLASLAFFSLALGALSLRPFRFSVWLWRMAVFLVGFVSPLLLWALILIAQGGAEAWHLYWKGILDGSTGVVKHMSLPFPVFEPTAPFSTESALALAYYSFLIIYAGCLVQGVKMAWAGGEEKRGWFLAAVGLMGAGIFPQALHRSDIAHLLQVLPPFLVGAGLLIPHLWHPVPASPRMQKAARGVAVVFLAGLLTAGWNLKQFGGSDWASLISDPVHRYPGLARG
ncbi:MAG: hypothetical protein GWN10_16510, partial [Nitrospinaceae bacterium]|nr:hypothetical protein [Nitrospinaceae bacterium]NIU45655.1 hypothetical protein [Nitrospinaceae bacterium]NIU97818.1 hypothetical protein [Nitrospinaceae bacterium]NIW07231.1 hypothetical protein [Nitrospinaceae bacterium]NIW60392.1 hypothetical protein [Nitrospinaceae bacterium]